jgi:hypothetical protein
VPAPDLTLVPPGAPPARAPARELREWAWDAALDWRAFANLAALADPRHLRDLWLADLREVAAETLRSPAFLALMKFNLTLLARRTPPNAP